MRHLTRSQKKLLREWFEANKANVGLSFQATNLPDELYRKLEQMNDFETIVQELESFIRDLVSVDTSKEEARLTKCAKKKTSPAQ